MSFFHINDLDDSSVILLKRERRRVEIGHSNKGRRGVGVNQQPSMHDEAIEVVLGMNQNQNLFPYLGIF